jgi:excisionase family DNA binding protein
VIERFLTTEQVANILQVHPFTILKFIREGKLKGIKLGRVYRIKESDVHEFLDHASTKKPSFQEKPSLNNAHTVEPKPNKISGEGQHYYII